MLLIALPLPSPTLFPTRRSSDLPFRRVQLRRSPAGLYFSSVILGSGPGSVISLSRLSSSYTYVHEAVTGVLTVDRKSTRLNSSHLVISYAVFCLKKKINNHRHDI